MKIALVHDDFIQLGGAERLFEEITKIFPTAPVYTSHLDYKQVPKSINQSQLKPSYMQKIPFAKKLYKALLPIYPLAFELLDLSEYDLVISSTTRFAKSVITKPSTTHICYTNSIPRFIYETEKKDDYLTPSLKLLTAPLLKWLKRWDIASSSRVDLYLANSKNVQTKIHKYYGRKANILYPFADTDFYKPTKTKPKNYYLIVSRLVKWKRIDIAIKSIDNHPLIIVGAGPDKNRLVRISKGKSVQYFDRVEPSKLRDLYRHAKSLIVTQDEDFGISAVEAQSCGTPVIGYAKGGVAEIIINKKTGILFEEQTVLALKDAIINSSRLKYNKHEIRLNALRFTKSKFRNKFRKIIKPYVTSA